MNIFLFVLDWEDPTVRHAPPTVPERRPQSRMNLKGRSDRARTRYHEQQLGETADRNGAPSGLSSETWRQGPTVKLNKQFLLPRTRKRASPDNTRGRSRSMRGRKRGSKITNVKKLLAESDFATPTPRESSQLAKGRRWVWWPTATAHHPNSAAR